MNLKSFSNAGKKDLIQIRKLLIEVKFRSIMPFSSLESGWSSSATISNRGTLSRSHSNTGEALKNDEDMLTTTVNGARSATLPRYRYLISSELEGLTSSVMK